MISLQEKAGLKGKLRITKRDSLTGEILYQSDWINNKIVSSSGYGRNIIMRQLAADTTYAIAIDSAQIGTGTNTPADSDIALQTPTATFSITDKNVSNDALTISIFMTDALLANGTYSEFGLRCDGRLFSRVLISPTFTKSTNQDTTIDYVISLT